jgi:unsaturated rhamnogalacturonyl hydrolase
MTRDNASRPDVEKVIDLCRDAAKAKPPSRWMWGDALFGYALAEWDRENGTDEFTAVLKAYCDRYVRHPPAVDYADRAAPALVTYAMQKKTGSAEYKALTDKVLHYIRHAPRVLGDAVNHLGHSLEGRFYPKSIWVDSLMMFSLFPALYASENNDPELLDFAARQPRIYSGYMQDPECGLWYHSYWVKAARHHPKGKVFWARGNGWVLASLPRILDLVGENHPEYPRMLHIFQKTVKAVLACENPDHSFNTLLTQKSYREMSATALIAAGVLHGARRGYLERGLAQRGLAIFHTVAGAVRNGESGLYLPEISAPTIPLHVFPELGYRLTPRGRNHSYGLAAALFAAIEAQKS